ncbi:calmodulin-regulated spectrin-associated protein 2 isoform X2 [Pangasianodon hypophthalmus]|uniref:calmodulin-regulated spectrin-associated protein 2 isoform X2 n=1 Tax=Pangasianodon hypophthalmus TaxID=310915 RepID=UPI000EFE9E77|nr:calmodulin-regulated spectrin-associated protein 2 isoform X2 [Pangasianodon hypophthalmus]
MEDAGGSKHSRRTFIVPAIKSFDHYDFARAKIACSLTWLVAKAFGSDCIPVELEEPFYKDQYEQEHLKPPVASLLLSAELYCRAGSLILRSDAARPLLGHNGVIQALAQKGLYVTDQERLVTERDLCKTPIQMSSHLAMIDTLMMAYTVEMISVERVLTCVQKYSPFFPEEDFPYDAEEAVTTWINKVNEYLRETMAQEQRVGNTLEAKPAGQKGQFKKEDPKAQPALYLPLVDNLLKDNTDGCALTALLHFYCPNAVPLEDICVKETMSLADSLSNLQLIQDFCRENLNNCCHFTLEDMLYASSCIKSNYLVFMAELFWWFEVVKPSFVQPRTRESKVEATKMAPITKHNLIHRPPSPDPLKSPNTTNSAMIKRSNSLSYVDGCVGTWPKEKRSSAHGISFEIPFDDPMACMPSQGLSRSASSEGLGFKVPNSARGMRRNLSFQPVNGNTHTPLQEEEDDDITSHHGPVRPLVRTDSRYSNGVHPDVTSPQPPTPTMEEALKIIHNSECSHSSLRPPVGENAFFLHPPEAQGPAAANSDLQDPKDSLFEARVDDGQLNSTSTEMDTGIHVRTEDIQDGQDEDSSLKDYSDMDQDYEARSCPLPDTSGSFSPVPSLQGPRSLAASSSSSIGSFAVRMTSFAEQKFRKLNHGEGRSGGNTPENDISTTPARAVARSDAPDARSPSQASSPRDPSSLLVSEMVQLKMKLEEKRRAIEAQKKKVEAAFTRHRQRMGRTAFLNIVRRKGTISPLEGDGGSCRSLDEKQNIQPQLLKTNDSSSQLVRCKPDGAPLKLTPEEGGSSEMVDLAEYTRSIERLNASLSFLQTEMQRLAQQQEHIMRLREQQSWVISPPHTQMQTSLQKHLRELRSSSVVCRGSVGSLSPNLSSAGSPRTTQRSPAPIKRKSASFHARTPRTPRPSELKVTPFSRMLNTPQSVDSLPRLRRFSPRQTQTSSFAYLGHDEGPRDENNTNKEEVNAPAVGSVDKQPDTDAEKISGVALSSQVTENQEEKDEKEKKKDGDMKEKPSEEARPIKTTAAFQVQSQAVIEHLDMISTDDTGEGQAQVRKDLIEVPLSELKPLDDHELESGKVTEGRVEKMCCGFFYRDDQKGEEDIAQKRAALLEKRLRREKEMQTKKRLQEQEIEQKKEMSRLKAEEDRQKKEEEKARREFIKNEYLRRRQLKLMEDMDSVIKPRPPSIKQKKPRPKSMHRDIVESPKPSAQTYTGSRPRGYSVSSISLASLNLADNESVQTDKRMSRPETADGQLSPCPSVNRNGENWENESTSSAASNTEYTGPKLYKEPSAKSNKYIIQNALAHCCLAGKVNEGQKNKILEEMEKTESNNFLILFRDSGCQFRALYTYCPETEEISKLAGIGPKAIMPRMIENLYKYSSDKKQFCHIPAKTMSASIDAITIYSHLWQTKKQSTPKKLLK